MSHSKEVPTGTVLERIQSSDAPEWRRARARAALKACGGCSLRLCDVASVVDKSVSRVKSEEASDAVRLIVGNPVDVEQIHMPCDKNDCPGVVLDLESAGASSLSTTYCFED